MERMTVFTQEVPLLAPEGSLACDGEVFWSSLVALATGALLGVLAGMPYDVLFGLPEPACAVLRSLVLTATWSCVGQVKPVHMGPNQQYPVRVVLIDQYAPPWSRCQTCHVHLEGAPG